MTVDTTEINRTLTKRSVRESPIPYGRQTIGEDDIDAVCTVLRSDWLTTGPTVQGFEQEFATMAGCREAISVCNGTAALHAAAYAIGISSGDEVIVPSMTFAATANAVVYQGGRPVFTDSNADDLLIDPDQVLERITPKTKAIFSVDFAGQPCDYRVLSEIASDHGILLIDDASHSLGGAYRGRPVGSLADCSTFSFHPVKNMTTAEGGMVTTDDPEFAQRMRLFRNHGITSTHYERAKQGSWHYEMVDLGFNYRLSDVHAALGRSQMKKLPQWIEKRGRIAQYYLDHLRNIEGVAPLRAANDRLHAYHLFVIRLHPAIDRDAVFAALRRDKIGVNVHYSPVHLHPFYRETFGTAEGLCPVAEDAGRQILSLPIFPAMSELDCRDVILALETVLEEGI